MLLERHTVDAIVSLPAGLFLPYTGVKSNLLLLRREGPTRQVRMVDASRRGTGQPRSPKLDAHEIAEIAAELRATDGVTDAWDVAVAALSQVDWDLTVRRRDSSSLDRV